ncbi:sensor domain-containing diguanylate cyclase [Halomonas sp. TRM85114]|uniref:sensor domain-containing diguanylate cyclase n=1 Tax=Halomonas jincaotanensis TaxID=2810616 RepID=UPI001BD5BC10|nr:sensor domain-containing diguanylate cyclase [Halomonas jincaotanensis]MBS9403274.1 sensor domain-containing diguanylate cyclase [Halomonas jincaotanensis]
MTQHNDSAVELDPVLAKLANTITENDGLENLTRPLLELLQLVTGLESTYLTSIDLERNNQCIIYSLNTREMRIPELLTVDWDDTLCKRALAEGVSYTDEVSSRWGDSKAARDLGIATYLSEPIRMGDGALYGTLCGASQSRVPLNPQAKQLLGMFSRLIGQQIERDLLVSRLRAENLTYSQYALQDPLTGIPNRRALHQELTRALANAGRTGLRVHVAFIDLDGFKAINDEHGHDLGDRLLIAIARSLESGMRTADFVSRYGGDEFVFFGTSSPGHDQEERGTIHQRLRDLTSGSFSLGTITLRYQGASIGVVSSSAEETDSDALLVRADAAMYIEKQKRREG